MFVAAPEYPGICQLSRFKDQVKWFAPDMTLGLAPQQDPGWVPATSQCFEIGVHSPNNMIEGNTKLMPMWMTIESQMTIRKPLEKSNMRM